MKPRHPVGRERRSSGSVFGPVPSRRLGRSLGVDLVPFKTCSYDCIYCQLGRTTRKIVVRGEWIPMRAVLEEVKRKLSDQPDYITLSGSGEPTLYSRLGELIEHLRGMTKVPIAVLTNGSLLWRRDVREEVALADVVMPSLDAPDPELFGVINRPHPDITFARLLEGLESFRRVFRGRYWLEVMLLEGYTTAPAQVDKLAALVRRIRPDRVHLNTAVRPPAEEQVRAVASSRLAKLSQKFGPSAEVIAEQRTSDAPVCSTPSARAVLALLRRRPCTAWQVARGLGIRPNEALKILNALEAGGKAHSLRRGSDWFYRAAAVAPARPSIP